MACNTCAKSFTLLRKEKACPACGFSYCSTCLNNKMFIKKIQSEAKVCAKCKRTANSEETIKIQPPDAYYKRIGVMNSTSNDTSKYDVNDSSQTTDSEILQRLQKLKENPATSSQITEREISDRLQKIKGGIPSTSNKDIEERLARLRGVNTASCINNKPLVPAPDLRTEQEQADDLMKQYLQQANIDAQYKNEFDNVMSDIEARLISLKGSTSNKPANLNICKVELMEESEDDIVKNIVKEFKAQAALEIQELDTEPSDELPFCEICNEDATLRCLGCKYLFCKRCYLEHKDDDEGCNKYEPYKPIDSTS